MSSRRFKIVEIHPDQFPTKGSVFTDTIISDFIESGVQAAEVVPEFPLDRSIMRYTRIALQERIEKRNLPIDVASEKDGNIYLRWRDIRNEP